MSLKSISRTILVVLVNLQFLLANSQLYVLNSLAETVSTWDGETTTNNVATLGLYPNDMLVQGDSLLVLNSGSYNLQIFDRTGFSQAGTITLPENSNPYEMTRVGGDDLLVSLFQSGLLARINLTTGIVTDTVPTGPSPEGILVDGDNVFVTSSNFNTSDWTYGQGKVVVHDAGTLAIQHEYLVPTNPQKLLMAGNGMLHVLCTGNYFSEFGRVVRINVDENRVVDTLEIGGSPGAFAADGDGVVYVAAGGWGDAPAGLVYTYSRDDFVVLRGESDPLEVGHGVMSVTTGPQESGAWVASFDTDEVYHITAEGTITEQLTVGDGPSKIVMAPASTTDIAEQQTPTDFQVSSAYPNPFNPMTSFAITVSRRATVQVAVIDIRGHRVRELVPATLSAAGTYSVRWNGRDDRGRSVASGIYFLEISLDSRRLLQKVTLVR